MKLSSTSKAITSIALLSTLFAGCSATKPEAVNNKVMGNNYLYTSLSQDSIIKEFSNKNNGRGFIVNNYKPFGFKDSFYITSSVGNCLYDRKGKTESKYERIDAKMNATQVILNTMLLPLFLPLGLMCENYHAFNYENFDNDMKELLPPDDVKKLVSSYDGLKLTEHKAESKINEQIEKLNTNSLKKLELIKTKYLANNIDTIVKKVKITDKTGLYRNEKFSEELKIYKNNFLNPKLLSEITYSPVIDNSFPCYSVNGCVSRIEKSDLAIQNKYQNDVKFVSQQHNKLLKEDTKSYTELSKFYSVHNNLKKSTVEVKKNGITKNIFYTVDIKSNKLPLNEKLISTVTVTRIDYNNVFPKYENKDKNIEIIFNPYTKNYDIVNNTNKFIQIKSISLYYDGSIYNLTLSKDNNVIATELPPQARKTVGIYDKIKESNYATLTKRQAQLKNFKFGFALKYTIGEQTKNITLYSQDKHNLYSLIKNI